MSATDNNDKATPVASKASSNVTKIQKLSMKSTWNTKDRSKWSIFNWFFYLLDLDPSPPGIKFPEHARTEKIPYLSCLQIIKWDTPRIALPIILHWAYVHYTGQTLHPAAAFAFYSIAFKLISINELHMLRNMAVKYGFLDGAVSRDGIPDIHVGKVVYSLISTSTFRPILAISMAYDRNAPITVSPWIPLQMTIYTLALDFWFYWYHRLMHEVGWLWKFHRTHHLTKHPNPLLTLYADQEQEWFDIAVIPLLAYLTCQVIFPINFYEWWVSNMFVVFVELAGHSGLRLHSTGPSAGFGILSFFDAEIVIEDHDLHHRQGWKTSANYGKQTRVWDRVFGTTRNRIESAEHNVDYVNQATIPMFP